MLAAQEGIKLDVERVEVIRFYQRAIDVDVPLLADPVGPVRRLIFLGRVPVPQVVDDVVGRLDIDAEADGQWRQDDHTKAWLTLEVVDEPFAVALGFGRHAGIAVDDFDLQSEFKINVVLEKPLNIAMFREDQHLLAPDCDIVQAPEQLVELGRRATVFNGIFRDEDLHAILTRIGAHEPEMLKQAEGVHTAGLVFAALGIRAEQPQAVDVDCAHGSELHRSISNAFDNRHTSHKGSISDPHQVSAGKMCHGDQLSSALGLHMAVNRRAILPPCSPPPSA